MSVYRRGRTYYYDFRLDGVRHVKRVGPDKQKAKDAEDVARARLLEGRYEAEWGLRPKRAIPTVRAFIEKEFLQEATHTFAASTVAVARSRCGMLTRLLGRYPLTGLTPQVLESFKAARLAEASPAMLREDVKWLRVMLRAARRRGYLRGDPLDGFRLPRATRQLDRILSEKEEARLLLATPRPVLRAMWRLALLTGLREGEVASLRRAHVVLDRAPRLVLIQPKTGEKKVVPLLSEAVTLLRELIRELPSDAPVFRTAKGGAFSPVTIRHEFHEAVARARLPRLRFQDLRHTFATRLAQSGADLATVGDLLGHKPPYRETFRYFAHTSEPRKRAALEAMRAQQKSQRL